MGGEEIYIVNSLKGSRGVLQNARKMGVFLNFPFSAHTAGVCNTPLLVGAKSMSLPKKS